MIARALVVDGEVVGACEVPVEAAGEVSCSIEGSAPFTATICRFDETEYRFAGVGDEVGGRFVIVVNRHSGCSEALRVYDVTELQDA